MCLKLGHISEWLTISYVVSNLLYNKSILELDKRIRIREIVNLRIREIVRKSYILESMTFPGLLHSKSVWKTDHLVKPYFTSEETDIQRR